MDLDIFSKALNYLPGGVSYAVRYIEFSPIYVERAEGAYVWDVGGQIPGFLDGSWGFDYGAWIQASS